MEFGTKSDGSIIGCDLDVSHGSVVVGVGGHDDVDVLDDPLEGLLQLLLGPVHLVYEEDGLYPLGDGLTKDSFVLHTDT